MLFWASVAPSGIAEGPRISLTKTRVRKRVRVMYTNPGYRLRSDRGPRMQRFAQAAYSRRASSGEPQCAHC
jgi:hypothetical protein